MNYSRYEFNAVADDHLYIFRNQISIHLSEIILLEALDNYTVIYLKNGKPIIIAKTLKSF